MLYIYNRSGEMLLTTPRPNRAMYQSKAEAIEALSSLLVEMNCILSEDDHNDDEIEAIQGEIEAQYEEIVATIAKIKRWSTQYLQVEERNYVMLTVLEAKRTIAEATDLLSCI